MKVVTDSLILDDARTEGILRLHLKLPDDLWAQLKYHDVHLSGSSALEYGLADRFGEFSPPTGQQVYNILL